MIRFEIPYPPTKKGMTAWNKRYTLNAYWSGKPYHARNRDAHEIHDLSALSMRKAGVRSALLDYPVEVWFYWNDGLDADNHAALGKMILDTMKGTILHDDNRKWVKGVHHVFWDGEEIAVEVRPYDQRTD